MATCGMMNAGAVAAATKVNPFIPMMTASCFFSLPVSYSGYSIRIHAGLGSRTLVAPWALVMSSGKV